LQQLFSYATKWLDTIYDLRNGKFRIPKNVFHNNFFFSYGFRTPDFFWLTKLPRIITKDNNLSILKNIGVLEENIGVQKKHATISRIIMARTK